MLCLEISTGQRPFHNRPRAAAVIQDLVTGVRPMRPEADVTRRGLSDALWDLMQKCWHQNPDLRPSMSDILAQMKSIQRERAGPRVPANAPRPRRKYPTDGMLDNKLMCLLTSAADSRDRLCNGRPLQWFLRRQSTVPIFVDPNTSRINRLGCSFCAPHTNYLFYWRSKRLVRSISHASINRRLECVQRRQCRQR